MGFYLIRDPHLQTASQDILTSRIHGKDPVPSLFKQESIQTTSKKKWWFSLFVSFLTSIVFMSSSFVRQKTNLAKPTSNFNFCSLGRLPSFQWFPYGLPTMAGLPYGFPMPDAATKPSRPYRLGISQMQSDLATNLGPGCLINGKTGSTRLAEVLAGDKNTKTEFWDKLRQFLVTPHLFCFFFVTKITISSTSLLMQIYLLC